MLLNTTGRHAPGGGGAGRGGSAHYAFEPKCARERKDIVVNHSRTYDELIGISQALNSQRSLSHIETPCDGISEFALSSTGSVYGNSEMRGNGIGQALKLYSRNITENDCRERGHLNLSFPHSRVSARIAE